MLSSGTVEVTRAKRLLRRRLLSPTSSLVHICILTIWANPMCATKNGNTMCLYSRPLPTL